MKFNHHQVCTSDQTIEAGKHYTFVESCMLCNVQVLYVYKAEDRIEFELKIIAAPKHSVFSYVIGKIFTVSAAYVLHYGEWRLYNYNAYAWNGQPPNPNLQIQ